MLEQFQQMLSQHMMAMRGPSGPQGLTGLPGNEGTQGEPGIKGEPGDSGHPVRPCNKYKIDQILAVIVLRIYIIVLQRSLF